MFDNVSFFIGTDDRIGLVGRNGAGKSTLLKILAGQQPFDKGTIGKPKELTMGYLPQEMAHNLTLTPWQVAEKAFEEAQQLNASIDRISTTHWKSAPTMTRPWNWPPCWPMHTNG